MKRNNKNLRLYKKICAEIWEEREHRCADCKVWIHEAKYHNFAHGKKGRVSEKDCLDKDNIKLKCFACHSNNDHGLSVKNAEWLN